MMNGFRNFSKNCRSFQNKKNVDVRTCDWETRSWDGKKIGDDHYPVNFWDIPIGGGWLIRKEIFTKENFWYDEKIGVMEDFDLGVRILEKHKWERVPEVLRIYYIIPLSNETTVSSNMQINSIEAFYKKKLSSISKIRAGKLWRIFILEWERFLYVQEQIRRGE